MKKMKKLLCTFCILLALLSIPNVVNAKTISVKITTSMGLNVRSKATTESTKITALPKETVLKVDSVTIKGTGCSNGWYKITSGTYKNKYICKNYTKKVDTTSSSQNDSSKNTVNSSKNTVTSSTTKKVVTTRSLNVRKSATTNSSKITTLKTGTSLVVENSKVSGAGCSSGWYKIASGSNKGKYVCSAYTTKNPVESCSNSITASQAKSLGVSTTDTFVEVDLSDQKVTLYKKGKCVIKSDAVTGQAESKGGYKNAVDTRKGTFKIYSKETNHYFKSDNVTSSYWMPFDGGIGLHDATWRSQFGTNRTDGLPGSHGCVNLPLEAAKIIYNTVSVGTKVIVHS